MDVARFVIQKTNVR